MGKHTNSSLSLGVGDVESQPRSWGPQPPLPLPSPPPPPESWVSWLMPVFAIANTCAFGYSMYLNDCPSNHAAAANDPSSCIFYPLLRRFAFEPLSDNPLLGPSVATTKCFVQTAPSSSGINIFQGFNSLRFINLEDNCINLWDEIIKLSCLKSLEQLHLNKNKLKHIFYPAENSDELSHRCHIPFENLQCLLLGHNEIEDLLSVDSLNFFPSLVDFRLSENPITDPAKGGVPRFVLIARLAKVKMLNGSEVSARERKESEIRYVRLVMAKFQSEDPQEIRLLHPRFFELKALHGIDDEKLSSRPAGPQKMASGLLCITLKCIGASMGEKLPLTKTLPPTTTVGKLKVLCESFFKLKGIKLRLFVEEEGSPLSQLLDDDMAPLMDVGIVTGSTILVDEES